MLTDLTATCIVVWLLQLDYPVYWTLYEFCSGLCSLLDHLCIDSVSDASIGYCVISSNY